MLPEALARRGDARTDLTGPVAAQADRVVWLVASVAVLYVADMGVLLLLYGRVECKKRKHIM